jgi:hypothetical protein
MAKQRDVVLEIDIGTTAAAASTANTTGATHAADATNTTDAAHAAHTTDAAHATNAAHTTDAHGTYAPDANSADAHATHAARITPTAPTDGAAPANAGRKIAATPVPARAIPTVVVVTILTATIVVLNFSEEVELVIRGLDARGIVERHCLRARPHGKQRRRSRHGRQKPMHALPPSSLLCT